MNWDEDTFGLEYDLDVYNIVAVNDFNMGAMENKGLNVFNTAYTLADPKSATDSDYERVSRENNMYECSIVSFLLIILPLETHRINCCA